MSPSILSPFRGIGFKINKILTDSRICLYFIQQLMLGEFHASELFV